MSTERQILAYKPSKEGGNEQYLVKLRGQSNAHALWLTKADINNEAMVHLYRQSAKLNEPIPSTSSSSSLSSSTHSLGEKKEKKDSKHESDDTDTDDDKHNNDRSSFGLCESEFVSTDNDDTVNEGDGDESWMQPVVKPVTVGGTPHVPREEIKPFVLNPDSKGDVPTFISHVAITSWGGIRPSDLLSAEHAIILTNAYLTWRSQPMAVPASTIFRTTGSVRLPRVRTKRAEALARSNARYLLGCLLAVGFARATISLDMLAYEEVVRALLVCIDTRKLGSERRYQLMLELRTITWWIATRQPARIGLDKVPSAAFVEGLLADCGKEKRDAAKKREQTIDGEALIKSGKWLTPQDQVALTKAIAAYFTRERLNPKEKPMQDDAWRFQGHFILHLLNDDVVAVPRSELLGSLQRGTSCVFEKDNMKWVFKMEYGQGKTKAPTILRLPQSSNGIMRAWLKFYRPVLVHDGKHEYIFCNKNGSGPRSAFGAQIRALQQHYIGKSASPHQFRGMQASTTREAGIGNAEHEALCWSRQHTTNTCKRFYEKPAHKRLADITEKALERMRQKRRKLVLEGDQYTEVDEAEPEVVDEE